MSPETKKELKRLMANIKYDVDAIKTWDPDQFTIMRLSLLYSIADQIEKHVEV